MREASALRGQAVQDKMHRLAVLDGQEAVRRSLESSCRLAAAAGSAHLGEVARRLLAARDDVLQQFGGALRNLEANGRGSRWESVAIDNALHDSAPDDGGAIPMGIDLGSAGY